MNILSVSVQTKGLLFTLLLFLICVIAVHAVKLATVGYRSLYKKLPPDPPKTPEKKSEPVYFIVERKKKRAKSEYSSPREVTFK